jgi:hypothetical protein
MAFRTRSAVASRTAVEPFTVRETVAMETFARFATASMFHPLECNTLHLALAGSNLMAKLKTLAMPNHLTTSAISSQQKRTLLAPHC